MSATVNAYLTWARKQIGTEEIPHGSNLQPYAACAGHENGRAWCSTFLCCGARTVGLPLPLYSASCREMVAGWKRIGRFGSAPSVGAFGYIFFDGNWNHTFVVEAVHSPTTFTTIEGNTDVAGGGSGGKVMRHDRSTHNIGFGYPLYATGAAAPALPVTNVHAHPTPNLDLGSTGDAVIDLQRHLNAWRANRNLSLMNPDGVFGKVTGICVATFQKSNAMPATGKVNRATWLKIHTITKGARL